MKKKLFVEMVTLSPGGRFLSSEVKEATPQEITEFKSKGCKHDLTVNKLIYDIAAHPYDLRYCGVCDEFIGYI